jgi:hypothetical protein
MSQKHETKPRRCAVCGFYYNMTAVEIKLHAVACNGKPGDGYVTISREQLEAAHREIHDDHHA